MNNQPPETNATRRSWLGAIGGVAAGLLGSKLARPSRQASSTPASPADASTISVRPDLRSSPAPLVKPAPSTVKRHG